MSRTSLSRRVACVLFLALSADCFATDDASDLFHSIEQRLGYMEDVARYKAEHGLAVEDRSQKQIVLERARSKAASIGLDVDSVVAFYEAQISAAKAFQYRLRAHWLSHDDVPAHAARDLNTELRPALLLLGEDIAVSLREFLADGGVFGELQRESFMRIVRSEHLTPRDRAKLFDALTKIRLAEH